jgi:hypothetical protein
MPLYKFIANKTLTWLENLVLRTHFSEFHTGYRAYNRYALESVNSKPIRRTSSLTMRL